MAALTHMMDTKFGDFEEVLTALTQRMDDMELDIQQLKVQFYPQHSASTSINLSRFSPKDGDTGNGNGNDDRETAPMDTEEGTQH
jgi:hypothetical protein